MIFTACVTLSLLALGLAIPTAIPTYGPVTEGYSAATYDEPNYGSNTVYGSNNIYGGGAQFGGGSGGLFGASGKIPQCGVVNTERPSNRFWTVLEDAAGGAGGFGRDKLGAHHEPVVHSYGSSQYGYDIPKPSYGAGHHSAHEQFVDRNAPLHANPWHAAILMGPGRQFLCSGALYKDRYVITAASCVKRYGASYLYARLGDWDIKGVSTREQYPTLETRVSRVLTHPHYDAHTRAYDIAILSLSHPVDFLQYPHVTPICLSAGGNDAFDEDSTRVAGWNRAPEVTVMTVSRQTSNLYQDVHKKKEYGYGYEYQTHVTPKTLVSKKHEYSKVLQQALVKKVERDWCLKELGGVGQVGLNQECLYGVGRDEACIADVGSPVVCKGFGSLPSDASIYAPESNYVSQASSGYDFHRVRRDTHAASVGYDGSHGSAGSSGSAGSESVVQKVYMDDFHAAPSAPSFAAGQDGQYFLCGVVSHSYGCPVDFNPLLPASGEVVQHGSGYGAGLIYGPNAVVYTQTAKLLPWIHKNTY